LFVGIKLFGVVDQVPVAVHTLLLVAGPGIDHRLMSQHGSALVWNVEKVAVALLALFILKGSIGLVAVLVVIVRVLNEMNDNIFGAVEGLRIEEVKGIVWGRKVTIHAVGYKTLSIVYVGRGLPRIVRILNLVTPRTKLGRRCTNHGVVGEAEKRESYKQTYGDKDGRFDEFLHGPLLRLGFAAGGFRPLGLLRAGPQSLERWTAVTSSRFGDRKKPSAEIL
jgi:hypothetical protein